MADGRNDDEKRSGGKERKKGKKEKNNTIRSYKPKKKDIPMKRPSHAAALKS